MFEQAISKEIFEKKYCIHGETSVEEVFTGVAEEIASCEDEPHIWQDVFYEEMIEGKFLPAGRILANARLDSLMKNYQNCYVIPIEDSMEGIYTALRNDALIGKMGGGVGFNISNLRPRNASISKGGESSGPMSFLDIFDVSAKAIHTGGARRSAHICILDVSHPDIEEFVTYKKSNGKLTQFNISVGITDAFMLAVKYDMDWDLQFGGKVYKTVKAKYLYDLITENMYEHNEPGVFFLDTVNDNNSGSYMYDINSPNPCGEQPLPDFGCCCLGALNLSTFVKEPFTDKASFDTSGFKQSIHHAVRFLDNVLSTSDYPIEEVRKQVLSERRIGLGFTGLADTFTMMGIVYGDDDSLDLSNHIGLVLRDTSYYASIMLAKEKGKFDTYSEEIFNCGFVSDLPDYLLDDMKEYGLRNIALNTVAPTGTTSLSIGNNCSSGIEPVFALEYTRNVKQPDDSFIGQQVYSRTYLMWKKMFGDKELPKSFITADKISIEDSVNIQEVFQEYIDASISKTLTLPNEFTYEQYQGLLMDAWIKGLKGITTFNPNGSLAPILSVGKTTKKVVNTIAKRDKTVPCNIHEITVNKQKFIVLVGIKNDEPYEVFLTKNNESLDVEKCKQGSVVKVSRGNYKLIMNNGTVIDDFTKLLDDDYAIMCRHFSLELRHGIDLRFIVDQLNKTSRFDTFSKAMVQVLKKYIKDNEEVLTEGNCPECEGKLVYKEGCVTCQSCGYSKC